MPLLEDNHGGSSPRGPRGNAFFLNFTTQNIAKPICSRIKSILKDCYWRVGKDVKISLNSTCWIPPDRIEENLNIVYHHTDGRGNWNKDTIIICYNEPNASTIISMPILLTGIDDKIVWTKWNDGNYSVRKEYKITTKCHFDVVIDWGQYWRLPCIPKILLFRWKCVNDTLPLGVNLLNKKFNIDGKCVFGCDTLEIEDHLFLGCDLIRQTWLASSLRS